MNQPAKPPIKPIVLVILDGWGISDQTTHNPIQSTATPMMDELMRDYPHTTLIASGKAVGLPDNQIGNSEVGHLHIGAGRRIYQDLTRIQEAIASGEYSKNSVFLNAIERAKQTGHAIHVLGLLSSGGVHSHLDHFVALLKMMAEHNFNRCYVHAILDGRDTAPQSAAASLQIITELSKKLNTGQIVSVIGRYYAMDRDNRWQRTASAYDLMVAGKAEYSAPDAQIALKLAYERGETDEFVKSTLIKDPQAPIKVIENGDQVIFMNFRADRARQLCHALVDPHFNQFERNPVVQLDRLITMTQYAKDIPAEVAFKPINLHNVLGEYLAAQQCSQLRIAETEKYAHVTYFVNGGREQPFSNEDRILIPSPKVSTYDLQPEMSAHELTARLTAAILSKKYDVIICNYANPDMIGHTGNVAAAQKAITTIDQCISQIVNCAKAADTQVLITADHGNIEQIYDENTQQPHTAHTTNLVPLIYVGELAQFIHTKHASLEDVAPTLLYLMGLPVPSEMTGENLIKKTE